MMIKPRQQKVLVIDEINYTRLMLTQALGSDGYKVASARNSGEAMQHISIELPDVILLSLRPGDSSGVSALRALRDYFRLRLDVAQGAEPAIIMVSDLKDTKQIPKLQSLGVSKSFCKPINIQELLDSVRSAVDSRKNGMSQERKKIIFVDSETRSQQFLESVLAHEMYDMETTDSEAELLMRIKYRRFDLAIIDLTSLESEITEILQSIKETAEEMPIVTIARSADQVSQDELKRLDVKAHFIKPLDIDVFRTEIDTLLQSAEELQEETTEITVSSH